MQIREAVADLVDAPFPPEEHRALVRRETAQTGIGIDGFAGVLVQLRGGAKIVGAADGGIVPPGERVEYGLEPLLRRRSLRGEYIHLRRLTRLGGCRSSRAGSCGKSSAVLPWA